MTQHRVNDTKRKRFYWTDTYLIIAEENFDRIFKEIYEEKFIDNIFMTNESVITKQDFKTAIAGDVDEDPKCDWLFSPSRVRDIFWESDTLKELVDDEINV